jgi:hypothetical protein
MGSSRLAGIPIDHLRAEVFAFPLASEAAFRLGGGLTSLDPGMRGLTKTLWRAAETALLGGFPGFSVDEAVAIRDRIWFPPTTGSERPLGEYVRRVAGVLLEIHGSSAEPACTADPRGHGFERGLSRVVARQNWRWVSFAVPPDLLLSGLGNRVHGPGHINTISKRLATIFQDTGYAETHLHIGAGLDFPAYWVSALNALPEPRFQRHSLCAPGAALGEGKELATWLLHAAIARSVLGAFLARSPLGGFAEFLRGVAGPCVQSEGGELARVALVLSTAALLRGRLGSDEPSFAELQSLYRMLSRVNVARLNLDSPGDGWGDPSDTWQQDRSTGMFGRTDSRCGGVTARDVQDYYRADPLAGYFPSRGGDDRSSEVRFTASALDYLCSPRGGDALFAGLFWQYVRIRCLLYRHVTQRPMTPGLQWFVRFYDRSGPLRRSLSVRTQAELAASVGGAGHGLRHLEFRTSPWDSVSEMMEMVHKLEQVACLWRRRGEQARPRIGLVFHFTKDRGGGSISGAPIGHGWSSHADPSHRISELLGNQTGYRFSDFYRNRRRGAMALERLLLSRPWSLEIVRGVDVCTDEIGVPNWVMAPLVRRVKKAALQASETLSREFGVYVPPLRTTVHAGEDFVHLLTGLRNVEDAIHCYEIKEGDRIGHGLALGVDPDDWAARAGRIPMACEERLWDLVYVWRCATRTSGSALGAWTQMVEREIARLSDKVFGEPVTPFALRWHMQALHNWQILYEAGFPDGPVPDTAKGTRRMSRLVRYLTDADLFNRGREIEWIDPIEEREMLKHLQRELRSSLGSLGIAVEVNPTSNLLIGDLGEFKRHPLWRMNSPRNDNDAPPLSVCIGSDDPLVFASDLRNEYQCLADAMAAAGLSAEQIWRWLNRVRKCGLETRFTVPLTPNRPLLRAYFTTEEPAEPMLI